MMVPRDRAKNMALAELVLCVAALVLEPLLDEVDPEPEPEPAPTPAPAPVGAALVLGEAPEAPGNPAVVEPPASDEAPPGAVPEFVSKGMINGKCNRPKSRHCAL